MSGTINKVIIAGRLGQDPKLTDLPSGGSVCKLSIATREFSTDKDGNKQERTEWHNVVVWGKQAAFCGNYLSKGRLVLVEGRLQTRRWQDQQGQSRMTTEIIAQNVQALDVRTRGDAEGNVPAAGDDRLAPFDHPGLDDVPF